MISTSTSNTAAISNSFEKPAERCISAVFQTTEQVSEVVDRLLKRGVPRDNISIIGRNFHSETRIAGFLTKKDIILDGLKNGAIFGSLFGSVLSLLTNVGVLFIPLLGPVVAAGPLAAALLGAATGAIAGSAGAGLVSALVTLGMPEDKAVMYETRIKTGESLVVVEVPADKSGEIQLLLQSAGGEELAITEMRIPRQQAGQLQSPADLSPEIRTHLSQNAQQTFIQVYNDAFADSLDENKASFAAWQAIEAQYQRDENGFWSQGKASDRAIGE